MDKSTLRPIIPSEMVPPLKPFLVTDQEGLSLLVAFLERTPVYGLDLETNVTDNFIERRIRTIQIGDKAEQYVVDLLAFTSGTEDLIASQGNYGVSLNSTLQPVTDALRPHLESWEQCKVGHGLQFEAETLQYCLGINIRNLFDLQRAEQNIYAGLVPFAFSGVSFWGLDDLVGRYCGLQVDKDMQKKFDLESPLTQEHIDYAALDVRLPMAVRNAQMRKLTAENLFTATWIDSNATTAFGEMRLRGIYANPKKWQDLIDANLSKRQRIIKRLDEHFIPIVGTKYVTDADREAIDRAELAWRNAACKTKEEKAEKARHRAEFYAIRKSISAREKLSKDCEGEAAINYGSSLQLLKALRKKGYSEKVLKDTNDRTLEQLAKHRNMTVDEAFENSQELKYGIIDTLRFFRTVDKLLSTYGDAWISTYGNGGHVHPQTLRIHSWINLFGAETGRTSSSKPNIQNLPKVKIYRHAFTARPGYKILTVDFNGAELRILAELSGEPIWLDAFDKGWDVHSVGAEIIFAEEWASGAEPGCKYVAAHQKCKCSVHDMLRGRVKAIKN